MRHLPATILAGGALLAVLSCEGQAQTAPTAPALCQPYDAIVDVLASRYREELAHAAVSGDIRVEIWVARETRTWTILLRRAGSAMACFLGAGEDHRARGAREVPS